MWPSFPSIHTTRHVMGYSLNPARCFEDQHRTSSKYYGQFTGKLKSNTTEVQEEIYVVEGLHRPLLGRPAIESLQLFPEIAPVSTSDSIISRYSHLFKGLGCLQGTHRIKLKEDAKLFALSTPRRISIPLRKKVKSELERMEKLGVISKVNQPTDWCAGMVIVPKSDGRVRICIDLTKLNTNVCRERHILPSVEQTLAQLGGATIFSKLKARSHWIQIRFGLQSVSVDLDSIGFNLDRLRSHCDCNKRIKRDKTLTWSRTRSHRTRFWSRAGWKR